jgi:hypothetical protein
MGTSTGKDVTMSGDRTVANSAPSAHTAEIPPGLVCHRCEYDLRAHPPEGRCPECGEPVAGQGEWRRSLVGRPGGTATRAGGGA